MSDSECIMLSVASFIQTGLVEDKCRPMTMIRASLYTVCPRRSMYTLWVAGVPFDFMGVLFSDGAPSFPRVLHGCPYGR